MFLLQQQSTTLLLLTKGYRQNLSNSSHLENVFNIKQAIYFTKYCGIFFRQFMVTRFKLFQSVPQNSNSRVTFYIPSCCHVSKSFIFLSSYLEKFIILLDNRTEQNNTSSHSTWYYFAEKNQVSFLTM